MLKKKEWGPARCYVSLLVSGVGNLLSFPRQPAFHLAALWPLSAFSLIIPSSPARTSQINGREIKPIRIISIVLVEDRGLR